MTTFHYPADLAARLAVAWPDDLPPDPFAAHHARLLEVAYQTSMSRDEERPVRLRLLLASADDAARDVPAADLHVLRFDRARPFDADELRRLAAAAPFETSLVGVAPDELGELRIWGIAWSGAHWLAPTWGGRAAPQLESARTVVHASGPGRLAVYAGGRLVASLERGSIATLATDVFASEWLPALFADVRAELVERHEHAPTAPLVGAVVRKVTQHMLRRALWLLRATHHGGMFLFVEPNALDGLLGGLLHPKYGLAEGEPRLRYRTWLRRMTDELAHAPPGTPPEHALAHAKDRLVEVEAAIFELSRVLASFAQVDGAALLTKRFELVAFGVEVLSGGGGPAHVRRAVDAEGASWVDDPEENVGTRHRAAYRFIHAHPHGLAIVVSQDGTVRFVAQLDGAVTYFEQYLAG